MLHRRFYFAKRAFGSNSLTSTQPSLFFYEKHTDPATKAVILELLPYFSRRRLGTFCFEYDHSINQKMLEDILLTSTTATMLETMESNERTEPLCALLSQTYMLSILAELSSNNINYKGIDESLGLKMCIRDRSYFALFY